MKRNDFLALHKKTDGTLRKQFYELSRQLQEIQVDRSIGKVKNVRESRTLRKDRARILTILRQRELAGKSVKDEEAKETKKEKLQK